MKIPLLRQLSTAGTIFLNTYEIVCLLVQTYYKFPTSKAPLHFLHGSRLLSVIHARLRNKSSDFKSDLFNNYVSTSDKCQICNEVENAEHFVFKCRRYYNHRVDLVTTTRILHPLNVKLIHHYTHTSYIKCQTSF